MQPVIAYYRGESINCVKYTKEEDEANILAIVPAWREYVTKVRLIGKSPQISSAFSQAFCCLKFDLVNRKSDGADAFHLDEQNRVIKVVELKATATRNKRNDIKVYPDNTLVRDRRNNPVVVEPAIEFDELYWFAANPELTHYSIYRFFREGILEYDRAELLNVRGGRINVNFKRLLEVTGSEPYVEGIL